MSAPTVVNIGGGETPPDLPDIPGSAIPSGRMTKGKLVADVEFPSAGPPKSDSQKTAWFDTHCDDLDKTSWTITLKRKSPVQYAGRQLNVQRPLITVPLMSWNELHKMVREEYGYGGYILIVSNSNGREEMKLDINIPETHQLKLEARNALDASSPPPVGQQLPQLPTSDAVRAADEVEAAKKRLELAKIDIEHKRLMDEQQRKEKQFREEQEDESMNPKLTILEAENRELKSRLDKVLEKLDKPREDGLVQTFIAQAAEDRRRHEEYIREERRRQEEQAKEAREKNENLIKLVITSLPVIVGLFKKDGDNGQLQQIKEAFTFMNNMQAQNSKMVLDTMLAEKQNADKKADTLMKLMTEKTTKDPLEEFVRVASLMDQIRGPAGGGSDDEEDSGWLPNLLTALKGAFGGGAPAMTHQAQNPALGPGEEEQSKSDPRAELSECVTRCMRQAAQDMQAELQQHTWMEDMLNNAHPEFLKRIAACGDDSQGMFGRMDLIRQVCDGEVFAVIHHILSEQDRYKSAYLPFSRAWKAVSAQFTAMQEEQGV